jgi:hypothetical protein
MPLTVYCCVTYSAVFGVKTQDLWTALHFVNAVKGTPLAGYACLPLPSGETVRIDRSTWRRAPAWFARMIVPALPWRDLVPCAVVPVPDARCDLAADRRPRTFALASALALELGPDAVAVDLLRWCRPIECAHRADGSRDPQVLYGRLRMRDRGWPIAGQRVMVVDDVMVTGGHIRAAAAFLADSGARVMCAVCAARADGRVTLEANALVPASHRLPDFQSDPDWLLPETSEGIEL